MSEHELWNELGNLYFMSGAYNQAVHAYQRSIKLDAGFGRPYSNLALTYVQQGRFDEAIELYRRSIDLLAEDKEKATSWNRLGAVYRHLKDYSKAVIAFQEADELDPAGADEFPPPVDERVEPAPIPSSVLQEPVEPAASEDAGPDWWDAPGDQPQSQVPVSAELTESADDPNASWTPTDPTEFQENLSRIPVPGSLTTWGDAAGFDDDFEAPWPPDPEPEVELSDPDDDVATWLPAPEEAPLDANDLRVPAFVESEAYAEGEPLSQNESASYHVIQSMELAPLLTAGAASSPIAVLAESVDPAWQAQEVDLDLHDRPAPDFALAVEPQTDAADVLVNEQDLPEPMPGIVELPTDELEASQRDEEDMREVELGIAKFRRVVQLNPRNAHAWDALGTLYKAAGLYRDAILSYQQAISNDPSRSLYYHHLGLVYACEGRDEDAIGAFQRVIEIDPEYSLAHATLGGYYRKMGLEDLAQKHIGKAMKNIFDSENEYNRACLEAICGNADQAIELLGVALKNKQTYVDWILRDPDLDFIRQDPRFKQLISDYAR